MINSIESVKKLGYGMRIRFLGGGKACFIDAVINSVVNALVPVIDVFLKRCGIQVQGVASDMVKR